MLTQAEDDAFWDDHKRLTLQERAAFREAVRKFVHDLRAGTFRQGLRVKRVQGRPGAWELTWADDGRATFAYGPSANFMSSGVASAPTTSSTIPSHPAMTSAAPRAGGTARAATRGAAAAAFRTAMIHRVREEPTNDEPRSR